jgi:hypothetical protein
VTNLRSTGAAKQGDVAVALLGALWVVLLAIGFVALWKYARTPGTSAEAPLDWPSGTHAMRSPGRPALVLFLHPKCPCSRATLTELREIVGRSRGAVDVTVEFVRPAGVEARWEETALWRDAGTLPGTTVLRDEGGLEAKRFGAETSGQALFYDGSGRRLFSGGITGSRGHAGANVGASTVAALIADDRAELCSTPVYGCPLASSEALAEGDAR